MKPHRRTVRALIGLSSLLLIFHFSQSTAVAKDTWTSVKSRNFNLVGNASEKEIREVAVRLEQFREVFSRLLPSLKLASPVPTTVIVFKSDSAFKPYKPVADGKTVKVAGYFQAGREVNYIALSTEDRSEGSFRTIFHEYVHLLVNNTLGRSGVPAWFNEGLAEYYSSFEIADSRKVSLGMLIPSHLYLLRSSKLLPLETLFAVDYHSLHRNKQDAVGLFYAEAWAFVHYLIQGNEGKNVLRMNTFLELLFKNTDARTAFTQAFQTDYPGMEKELKSYIQRGTFRMNVATFAQKLEFDSQLQVSPLTEAQGLTYLGDLLSHIQRPGDAKVKLEQALALDPNLPMAHASLAMVLMEQKNYSLAKQHLIKAVEGNPSDYLSHYFYAYLLSREGMDDDQRIESYAAESAGIMRAELSRAIELKPDFAESYHLLAFVNLVTEHNLDDAVQLINKAVALSPGNEQYLFVLTQIYLRKQDFAAATRTIEPMAKNATDPRIRATAEGLLRSVKSYQESMARYERDRASNRQSLREAAEQTDQGPTIVVNPYIYLQEALRNPEPGEIRLQGSLTRLTCSAKGIVFEIKGEQGVLRLFAKDFDGINITTFTSDVGGELTCGARKGQDFVVVTYKPLKDAREKTEGALVSLEFVPADFKLAS